MASKIEWTEYNWEVTGGCDKISSGCRGCYAIPLIGNRFANNPIHKGRYDGLVEGDNWTGKIKLFEDRLTQPLHWRKARKVFVNSRSDLFHEDVPFEFIEQIFNVMNKSRQHIFQILTKRPERMLEYFKWYMSKHKAIFTLWKDVIAPLKHVWLGVSVEDQQTADERIPLLLQTPAAVRWISAEPLLGEILLPNWIEDKELGLLDWVVVGGESGPKARPMHPDWVRSIRDQCKAAGVPFFFKQWGEWLHISQLRDEHFPVYASKSKLFNDETFYKMGKKKAGDFLDGIKYQEYPK